MNPATATLSPDRPPGVPSVPRGVVLGIAGAASAFLLVAATLLPVPMLYFYDEGVYHSSASRVVSGDLPYRDFYLAHPPGLVGLHAAVAACGGGIVASRVVVWATAVAFAGLLGYFLARVQRGDAAAAPAAALGVLFLTSTAMYVECASQVHTQLPGMALTLLGSLCLLRDRPRPVAAGLLLAAASAFRIQVAFIGPAWIALLFATYGWSAGWGLAVRLTLAAALAAAAFHGAIALAEPNYLECILHSHTRRAPTPPGEKYAVLIGLFREPQVAVGFVAAALLAAGPRGPARGLGVFVVAETFLTLAGSRFLGNGYFLPVYPYLAGCGAIVLVRAATLVGPWRPLLAVAVAVSVLSGVPIARTTVYRWTTQRAFERDLIARVKAVPGRTVACTPAKVATFAGKSLPADYLCPDTTSPQMHEFGRWFVALSAGADLTVVNDISVALLSPADCRAIAGNGKPLIFATPADEATFRQLEGEVGR